MIIAPKLPDLSLDDAERRFLPPADLWKIAVCDGFELEGGRSFLNNISNGGFIEFEKSGEARTSRRLYSVLAAVKVRAMWELTRSGRSYEFAEPIANDAEQVAREMILQVRNIENIQALNWVVGYRADLQGNPDRIARLKEAEIINYLSYGNSDVGILKVGDIIVSVLQAFAPYWEKDRLARGLRMPQERYLGTDDDGRPLDPDHEIYRNLSPVEHAKRRLEIEKFIASREAKGQGGGNA